MEGRGVVQRIDGVPCLVLRRRQMEERPDEPLIHLESYNKGHIEGWNEGYVEGYKDARDKAFKEAIAALNALVAEIKGE
uniref:Uncharacterized protein n=1 Tax=viral metagenome TaxID=1070528 RepID=A0A6M3KWA5_9ZZZZ